MATRILLEEQNIISLRTAIVIEDERSTMFLLLPRGLESSIPGSEDLEDFEHTWLYRRKRSFWGEIALKRRWFSMDQDVKPMLFGKPPTLRLVWADSGRSVALYLNEEPWAFLQEAKRNGYSKGVLSSTIGNPWNQELFEKTFLK